MDSRLRSLAEQLDTGLIARREFLRKAAVATGGTVAGLGVGGVFTASPGWAAHDPNTFNEVTLTPPAGCLAFCVTTFAHSFPAGAFGPFGILFLPSGKVLVSDVADGHIYQFPNDTAGTFPVCPTTPAGFSAPGNAIANIFVDDMAMSYDGRIFATQGTQLIELAFVGGSLVKGHTDLTTGTFIVGPTFAFCNNPPFIFGIGRDPVTGKIYYAGNNQVFVFNPHTNTCEPAFHSGAPFNGDADGLAWSEDGNFLWVAGTTQGIYEFSVVRDASGNPLATPTSTVALRCGGVFGGPDGIAKGLSGTCLAPFVFTNNNDGSLGQYQIGTTNCTTFISGGTRGDFMKVSPRGWIYATQQSSVALIRPQDGSAIWEPTPGGGAGSCAQLVAFGNHVASACLHRGGALEPLQEACRQFENAQSGANQNRAWPRMFEAQTRELCAILNSPRGRLSAECAGKIRSLAVAIALFLQSQTGESASSFIPAGCGISVPSLP